MAARECSIAFKQVVGMKDGRMLRQWVIVNMMRTRLVPDSSEAYPII